MCDLCLRARVARVFQGRGAAPGEGPAGGERVPSVAVCVCVCRARQPRHRKRQWQQQQQQQRQSNRSSLSYSPPRPFEEQNRRAARGWRAPQARCRGGQSRAPRARALAAQGLETVPGERAGVDRALSLHRRALLGPGDDDGR